MNLSLSIIIPVYNLEKYIGRCLESLIPQIKEKTFIKVYLIDDGSSDKSEDIIQAYIRPYSNFFYFKKENGGVSSARNYGLNRINSDFVTFVDGDDYVSEDYIDSIYANLNINTQLLCFDHNDYTDKGITYNTLQMKKDIIKLEPHSGLYGFLDFRFQNLIRPFVCNKIFNVGIINKFGIRFNETKRIGEDTLFVVSYIEKINEMQTLNKSLYFYCIREGSAMNSYDSKKIDESIQYFDCFSEIAKENDLELDYHYLLAYYISRWFGVINNESKCKNYKLGIKHLNEYLNYPGFKSRIKELHFSKLSLKLKIYIIFILLGFTKPIYSVLYIVNSR